MNDTGTVETMEVQKQNENQQEGDEYDSYKFILFPHVEKGGMAKKLEQAAPYNMFLTSVFDSEETHDEPLTVSMQELLDESLGEIESSVQFSFIVNIEWLQAHYYFAGIL